MTDAFCVRILLVPTLAHCIRSNDPGLMLTQPKAAPLAATFDEAATQTRAALLITLDAALQFGVFGAV